MSNALAIAGKELRSYFTSPIGYVVVGFFALIYGFFFYAILANYVEQSATMAFGAGRPPMNVNDQLISPTFSNVAVILLFVLPLITMRTYAEEKRQGTMELLLTAPLRDVDIVLGKFLGALGLLAVMMAITIPHLLFLFSVSEPEWKPMATTYLGFFLMSSCFIAVGLFISSLTRNQIVAGMATFGVFLLLWIIDWIGSALGPTGAEVLRYLSIVGHFDDFTRGVLDTKHLVYYASFAIFGLFLTMRSVESERWRG
jgi:ABC-2 type transport system permease protein